MKKPFFDKELIKDRQNGIGMAVRQENRDFVTEIVKLLRKIHDLPRLMLRMKKAEVFNQNFPKLLANCQLLQSRLIIQCGASCFPRCQRGSQLLISCQTFSNKIEMRQTKSTWLKCWFRSMWRWPPKFHLLLTLMTNCLKRFAE